MDDLVKKVYRADLPVWILCGGLCGVLLWLPVWGNAYAGHGVNLYHVLIASAISVFAFIWLFRFRIEISDTELIFCSLFQGKQRIRHDEIKKIRLVWKIRRTLGGPLRLIVEAKDTASQKKELSINAKVFSRAAVDAVLELGKSVAEVDDNGLRDGIAMKSVRSLKRRKKDMND